MTYLKKSPWIIHYDASSCNGCDIEVLAALTPVYDVERFGIINTGNPKHADIFLVTGSVNEQNKEVVKNIYEQIPEPKVVVAIGICAASGGIFRECYNVLGGVDKVIPVDVLCSRVCSTTRVHYRRGCHSARHPRNKETGNERKRKWNNGKIRECSMTTEDQLTIPIEVGQLIGRVEQFKQEGYRLVQIGCTKIGDVYEINYSFDKDFVFRNLRITVTGDTEVPSISGMLLGCLCL